MASEKEIIAVISLLRKGHQPTMLEQLKGCTPFQKVIATLLSSRTKDKTVVPVVQELFAKYPLPWDLMNADLRQLEKILFRIGFYKVKSRNIKKLSRIIVEKYRGKVPDTFEGLTSLPGVGRKTANCVLAYAFNKPAIAVDVHVHRITNRLGWVKSKTPEETEEKLKKIVPKPLWKEINSMLVDYGQRTCLPRKPKCCKCKIIKYCEFGKCNH